MPNHVTNVVEASKKVIQSILNAEGDIDFSMAIPRHNDLLLNGASGVNGDSECAAELMCREKPNDNELIARLETVNRLRCSALDMSDESFEQFVMMMRNKRNHGFYHMMDFARNAWGTKWNAYDQDIQEERVRFDTAWSHPYPVIKELSKNHPDELITVHYADEDTGSNCGKYTIQNGEIVLQDIAPNWSDQSDQEKSRWSEFAIKIRYGDDAKPEDFDRDENWNYKED